MAYQADDPLTRLPAVELARLLQRREVSSEEVVRSYLDRIITLDGKIGAFVEVHRGPAFAAARAIDEARVRGDEVGPLSGLPVSIKESLDMEGRAPTLGIVARKSKLATRDAAVVTAVRRAGGVVIGRTNVPQLLLSHETRNPLYGFTKNPFSAAHAPGGSSGGESAALASGMSLLGVGTDIGGSIRVPAAWTGTAGLKPTLDRWSNRGSNGALTGQETIRSQCGPMARSARDLAFFFNAIDPREMCAEDPLVPPLALAPIHALDQIKRLRVGYFVDDGLVKPSVAVGRAVGEAVRTLEGLGCAVVPFCPPNIRDAIGIYFATLSSDGGETAFEQLNGSAMEPTLAPLRRAASLPGPVRDALETTLRSLGEERAAWLLGQISPKSVATLWKLTKRARDYRLALIDQMARDRIDILLCPAHATPAVPHTLSAQFTLGGSFSMLFNLVQFPAGVVLVTQVQPHETTRAIDERKGSKDRFDTIAQRVDNESVGLPVGVQIVGRPFTDETVLSVMVAIETVMEGRVGRPIVPRMPTEKAVSSS